APRVSAGSSSRHRLRFPRLRFRLSPSSFRMMRGRLSRSTGASSRRVSESSRPLTRGLTEAARIRDIVNAAGLDVGKEILQPGAIESALLVEVPQQVVAAG